MQPTSRFGEVYQYSNVMAGAACEWLVEQAGGRVTSSVSRKTTFVVAGEEAGHQIKHGCRQGICHECTCRLKSGSVRDLVSGERIDGEGQPIRLCVSSAMSDVELESMT